MNQRYLDFDAPCAGCNDKQWVLIDGAVQTCPMCGPPTIEETPAFDGETIDPELDQARLATALGRVYAFLSDGQWRTLAEIAEAGGCTEAGASARIRDLRKKKFRALYPNDGVPGQRFQGGLWKYRMIIAADVGRKQ